MTAVLEQNAYVNARARAVKSRLFDRRQLDDLLDRRDMGYLMDVLLEHHDYAPHMAEAVAWRSGADAVEVAVSRRLTVTAGRLLAMCAEPLRSDLGLWLTQWDLPVVKALIRARHHEADLAATHALAGGPTLSAEQVADIARRPTMAALAQGVAAWRPHLGQALRDALPAYADGDSPRPLEDALDWAHFIDATESLAGRGDEDARVVEHLMRMEVDRINLRLLFTMAHDEEARRDVARRLLPGGLLPRRVLYRMLHAASAEEAMEALAATAYTELVEGVFSLVQTGRFGPMERLFDHFVQAYLRREARMRPLGPAVPAQVLWLLYNETVNLRLIARGIARALPAGRVREEMIHA